MEPKAMKNVIRCLWNVNATHASERAMSDTQHGVSVRRISYISVISDRTAGPRAIPNLATYTLATLMSPQQKNISSPIGIILRSPPFLNVDLRSEEHTSELQSRENLVCRLLLEKKKT